MGDEGGELVNLVGGWLLLPHEIHKVAYGVLQLYRGLQRIGDVGACT
jgi:hypothetical protein